VTGWTLAQVDADGSYVGGLATASLTIGRIAVERPGGDTRALRLEVAGSGRPGGPFSLDTLHLTGDGLDVQASAEGTAAAAGPLAAKLRLTAEPGRLAPELAIGGSLAGTASVRLPEGTIEAHVEATGLALDALRPYLGADLLDRAAAAGTTADFRIDVAGPFADPDRLSGTAHLTWLAGAERRLEASAALTPQPGSDRPARLELTATVLPDLPGTRRVEGAVAAATLAGLAAGTLEPTTVTLDVPDLAAAYRDLRERWPRLVPALGAPASDTALPPPGHSEEGAARRGIPARLERGRPPSLRDGTPRFARSDSTSGEGTASGVSVGSLIIGTLAASITASGPVSSPHVQATATWAPEAGTKVSVDASGEPMLRRGDATVTVERLRLSLVRPDLGGVITATAHVTGSPDRYRGSLTLDGEALSAGPDSPALDVLHVEAATDGARVTVPSFSGAIGAARFSGSAEAALALPLADARLAVHLTRPVPQVESADVALRLADGVLHVDVPGVDTAAGSAALAASVPLGALRAIPALAGALNQLPVVMADGPIRADLDAPALDSCTLLPLLGMPDRPERLRAGAHLELLVDPADPTAALAEVTLSGVRVDLEDRAVTVAAPIRLQLADRRLQVSPVEISTDAISLDLAGEATLAAHFRPGEDPPAALVEWFSADIAGAVDTALLRPYLVGGVAEGELRFDAHAAGTPAVPTASFSLYGPDVSFFWPVPYATRLTGIDLSGEVHDGVAELRSGRAALNGGTLALSGGRSADGAITASVTLADVRYRLDYGVSAVIDGDLRLTLPPAGRGSLGGQAVLRRAVLNRDIDLDREVLRRFLSPVTTAGTESGFLDSIDLDVALSTVDGVKVKNNVADLALTWEPLAIGGTAWNWTIKGRVDVQPGGLVFAYGQTVRIDRGSFTFTGDPINDPRIDLATTSSLQDPSIARLAAERGPLAALGAQPAAAGSAGDALAAGVAGYFGERVGSRITESLGLGTVSLRPVLIFGETDPGARLTLTRDFSRNVAFAFSLDLRNAQRQTYLLDLHGFHAAPTLTAQVFTTDQSSHGVTVQQTLELGGGKRTTRSGPRLQRISFTAPKGVSRRAMRAAIALAKGDTLPPGASFDVEVEVATLLRERGYPDADVKVTTAPSPTKPGRVDLAVAIEPGPHATFAFAGEKIPAGSRPLITSLYRTDYYESASLAEMEKAAVRVLRSLGFLDPRVTVDVARPDAAGAERTVTVRSEGGRRVAIAAPRFSGIGDEEAALIASRFPTALERAELASAARDADARVLESLRVLGYPQGRLAGRELSADGHTLSIAIDAGPRTRVDEVAITGLSPADEARLRPALRLAAGDPARADRIALAALAIEDDLHDRGFADAAVRTSVAASAAAPDTVRVLLAVDPGTSYRLGAVAFAKMRSTSESLARRVVALHAGDTFRPLDVAAARSRLAGLGVFSSVVADTRRNPDGTADVTFTTIERPRYTLAYGLRWDSLEGTSAVVDAVDDNFLGRSLTLGARALYERKDKSGRLYLNAPDLLGTRASLQAFVERRQQVNGNLRDDSLDSTFGLSRPLGAPTTARLYAAYRDSHLTEVEPDPFFPLDVRVRHPYLGAQVIVDTRSDPLLGGEGVFASADLSGSAQAIGSDFHYLRLFTQLNVYRSVRLLALPATWAQSVRVGLARPFSGQDLITDVRFFAGGQYSVRGYPNEGLGPTETLGDATQPVGGAALLVVNEEVRVPLPLDLTGLAFLDTGNVWARTGDFGRSLVTSLGLGVRARSPIGLLRLDAAFPLARRPGDARFTLYLGFGNAF
jgi:translocation and assembly module TamA